MTGFDSTVPRKRCSRCKRLFPPKYPYFNKNKNKKSGLEYHCRGCRYGWSADEFQIEVLRVALSEREYKECRTCEEIKPFAEFPKAEGCADGHRFHCFVCYSKAQREHSQKPEIQDKRKDYRRRDDVKARQRERENRPEAKARKSEYDKSEERKAIRREKNKTDEVRARRRKYFNQPEIRKKQNQINRDRYHENPEVKAEAIAKTQRRRARIKNLPESFTDQDWQRALEYFKGCCAVCGRSADEKYSIAADHWIPLNSDACSGTIPTNIVPLCHSRKGGQSSCNRSKGYRDANKWLFEQYGETKASEILERIEAYFTWLKAQS